MSNRSNVHKSFDIIICKMWMRIFYMCFESTWLREWFSTVFTIMSYSTMNCSNVFHHALSMSKRFLTKFTTKFFNTFMYCQYMMFKFLFLVKSFATFLTGIVTLSFMNMPDVCLQRLFFIIFFSTLFTYKFYSFMNCLNMFLKNVVMFELFFTLYAVKSLSFMSRLQMSL